MIHKDALQEKAADEARDIVEKAKREADGIIHDLRRMRIEKHAEVKEHELIDAQKKLNEAAPKERKSKKSILKQSKKHIFEPGDEVKVLSFDQKGQLISKVTENSWQVQIGILKMKVQEK